MVCKHVLALFPFFLPKLRYCAIVCSYEFISVSSEVHSISWYAIAVNLLLPRSLQTHQPRHFHNGFLSVKSHAVRAIVKSVVVVVVVAVVVVVVVVV